MGAVHRARIDDLVYSIITKIADDENTSIEALPPLGEAIDPEALERVLQSSSGDTEVAFTYFGWTITASATGRITMTETTTEDGPYVSRCNTCGDERHGVDLDTAQDFFASHAADRHEVEIVRSEDVAPDQPGDTEGPASEGSAGTN